MTQEGIFDWHLIVIQGGLQVSPPVFQVNLRLRLSAVGVRPTQPAMQYVQHEAYDACFLQFSLEDGFLQTLHLDHCQGVTLRHGFEDAERANTLNPG